MVTTTEVYEYYEYDFIRMTPGFQIPSAIALSLLILLAIVGNMLTICAFVRDRALRTVYDTYIFNLAVTDLLIGLSSMPFYAVYTLEEFTWDFGIAYCKVWLVIDFTLCLESVLIILLLSYDRLMLVTHGPMYSTKFTIKGAVIKIAISWLMAFLLYGPAIIGWDYWVGYSSVEEEDCDVEFAYNVEFTTATALMEFFVPVTTLAILNILLFRKIRQRLTQREKSTAKKPSQNATMISVVEVQPATSRNTQVNQNANPSPKITFNEDVTTFSSNGNQRGTDKLVSVKPSWKERFCRWRRANRPVNRESKAARVLAILVIVFLVCWAPYTITTVVIAICGDYSCINTSGYEVLNWLLWSKSAINPFLYAMNSSRYRQNFKRVLFFWKKGGNRVRPAEVTCHSDVS